MSCSRTQHGGGRSRTPDLSLPSPTLYHWATALPFLSNGNNKDTGQPHIQVVCWTSLLFCLNSIWAATWQNQQSECASSENSDQPGHPPSLIRVFADLSLCWAHTHSVGFFMSWLIILVLSPKVASVAEQFGVSPIWWHISEDRNFPCCSFLFFML